MRLAAATSIWMLIFMAHPRTLLAQAAAEYGLGVANAAGLGGAASGLGKKISGLADSLEKTVKSQPVSAPAKSTKVAPAKSTQAAPHASAKAVPPPKVAAPAPVYEDLKNVEVGLTYSEVVRRFGPPAMEIASSNGNTLTYSAKDGDTQIEIKAGTVVSVSALSQPGTILLK